jgi:hypothetical protein
MVLGISSVLFFINQEKGGTEKMDWKQVANEPWIWISGAILSGIALYQCTYFMIRALKIMKRCGLQRRDIISIIRGSVITSFGPVMSEIFIMIALVMALSAGFAWQREGAAVGSVFTELVQASNAAVGAGQEFGGKNFDMKGFANVVFVMNVSCIGWLIAAGFFTRYLGAARNKIAGGDIRWLSILPSARLSCFSFGLQRHEAAALVAVIAGGYCHVSLALTGSAR